MTDEDRDRYGRLLDRAAERGLLDAYDYEVRLRDLASASTIEEMNRIVTELPAFTAPPPVAGTRARASAVGTPKLGPGRRRSSPWLLLVVVVVVVVASLALLALYAGHLDRSHHSGMAPAAAPAYRLSAPRP